MSNEFADDVAAIQKIEVVPRILEVVCRTTGMGFAAVARVTDERWIACAVRDEIEFGLRPGGELEVKTTICDEIRNSNQLVAIDHVAAHPVYCMHHTPAMYGFQSYISVPLRRPDGSFFGTLCAIDPKPARVDNIETIGTFTLFADLIGFHLAALDRLVADQRALSKSRGDTDLREKFIAVLGHDLRNPLAAIDASGRALNSMPMPESAHRMVSIINSSATRMSALVNSLLDFARGKLGGGFSIDPDIVSDLGPTIENAVEELGVASSARRIIVDLAVTAPVRCDRARIAQLVSNLVGNALTHGDAGAPVIVRARTDDGAFQLTVDNAGMIPRERLESLFQPFARGDSNTGLGLGLYIASEITRAHGGTLECSSDETRTRFTLRLPVACEPTGASA